MKYADLEKKIDRLVVEARAAGVKTSRTKLLKLFASGGWQSIVGGLKTARAAVAQVDSSAFCEYVIRNENDPTKGIRQAPMHVEMHRMLAKYRSTLIWGSPTTGKSLQISVGYALFRIGLNVNTRIANIMATDKLGMKHVGTVGRYIAGPGEGHNRLMEVFPHLKVGDEWSRHAITVQRPPEIRDPTFQSIGVHGSILGAKLNGVIIDDILTKENTRTPARRSDIIEWVDSSVLTRIDPEDPDAFIIILGNAWHPDDMMHVYAQRGTKDGKRSFATAVFPIRRDGKTTWPEYWTQEALEKRGTEIGGWDSAEAGRQLDCLAFSDATSRFERAWFDRCMAPGLYGDDELMCKRLKKVPMGYRTYLGVDLGVKDKIGTSKSVIAGLMMDPKGCVSILGYLYGNWKVDKILLNLIKAWRIWKPTRTFVENVAFQDWLIQILQLGKLGDIDIPRGLSQSIEAFPTGHQKNNHPLYGFEGMGIELRAGSWKIPASKDGRIDPAVSQFITDCMTYSYEAKSGDIGMATYVCWAGVRLILGERWLSSIRTDSYLDTNEPETIGEVTLAIAEAEAEDADDERESLSEMLREAQADDFWSDTNSIFEDESWI